MTTPLMDDALYGIAYKCRRECKKCGKTDWYDLNATGHILIVDTKNLLRIDNMDELKLRIETEEYIYEEWIIENS